MVEVTSGSGTNHAMPAQCTPSDCLERLAAQKPITHRPRARAGDGGCCTKAWRMFEFAPSVLVVPALNRCGLCVSILHIQLLRARETACATPLNSTESIRQGSGHMQYRCIDVGSFFCAHDAGGSEERSRSGTPFPHFLSPSPIPPLSVSL